MGKVRKNDAVDSFFFQTRAAGRGYILRFFKSNVRLVYHNLDFQLIIVICIVLILLISGKPPGPS